VAPQPDPDASSTHPIDESGFLRIVFETLDWVEVREELSSFPHPNSYVEKARKSSLPRNIPPTELRSIRRFVLKELWEKSEAAFRDSLNENFEHPTFGQIDHACSVLEQNFSRNQIIGALANQVLSNVSAANQIEEVLASRYLVVVPRTDLKTKKGAPEFAKDNLPRAKEQKRPGCDSGGLDSASTRTERRPKAPERIPVRIPKSSRPKAIHVSKLSPEELKNHCSQLEAQGEVRPRVDRYDNLAHELGVRYEWVAWVAQRMYVDFEHSTRRQSESVKKNLEEVSIKLFFDRMRPANLNNYITIKNFARTSGLEEYQVWVELAKSIGINYRVLNFFWSTDLSLVSGAFLSSDDVWHVRRTLARLEEQPSGIESSDDAEPEAPRADPSAEPVARKANSHYTDDGRPKKVFETEELAQEEVERHMRDDDCESCEEFRCGPYECKDIQRSSPWYKKQHFHWGHSKLAK